MSAEIDCPLCGQPFLADTPWKKICLKCYFDKKKKDGTYQERPKSEAKTEYRKEYVYIREPGVQIEPVMLKRLIQLCHPDRNGNSEAATIATRFLLELKTRLG
jgi:hypothetical protein